MQTVSNHNLQARPVIKGDPAYEQVVSLYIEAFPEDERISLRFLRLFAYKPEIEFLAFFNLEAEGKFCGLTYTLEAGDYLYILFLAVDKDTRGQGIGTRILSFLREMYPGKALVLEIEPLDPRADNYAQRLKRLAFYERNGFTLAGYDMYEGPMRYTMLSTEKDFHPNDFAHAVRKTTYGLYRFKIVPAQ